MKTGKSIRELAAEVARQYETKDDYLAASTAMSMVIDEDRKAASLDLGKSQGFALTTHAHGQLAEYLGINLPYYKKMLDGDLELLRLNVNRWMERRHGEQRMVRTLDGSARAVLSPSYRAIDNFDVLRATLSAAGDIGGLVPRSVEVTESRLYVKMTDPRIVAPIKGSGRANDLVEAGFIVSNSEIGLGRLTIAPFKNFLACTNGMVVNRYGKAWTHLGSRLKLSEDGMTEMLSADTRRLENAAILSAFGDILRACLDPERHGTWADEISCTVNVRVTDPVRAVENVTRSMALLEEDAKGILNRLIEGADLSQFGLVNAITRHAEDQRSYDRATEIETVGGDVAAMSEVEFIRIADAIKVK
jgi:hypothetical protein